MEQETVDNPITEQEMIDEAMRLMAPQRMSPDEITVAMFMEIADISRRTALNRLNSYVERGLLNARAVLHEGREVNAYSPAIEGGWRALRDILLLE
jgi:hypothetical protein